MNKNIDQIKGSIQKLSTASDDNSRRMQAGANESGFKWTELKSKIDLVSMGLGIAKDAAEQFFAASKEGAQLTQLQESFDGLNSSILRTPDLLEQMRVASRGTVTDTALMEGVLKLTAGASDDLARNLAVASPAGCFAT
jgi:hypothetical protein